MTDLSNIQHIEVRGHYFLGGWHMKTTVFISSVLGVKCIGFVVPLS